MANISDEDLLNRIKVAKSQSLGLSNATTGGELLEDREKAQLFFKGDMTKFIPSLENRSAAVSTILSDTVKQVKPMIASIFRDERVVAFNPLREEDRAQAQLETDYLNYVIFDLNNGYRLCETISHDALLMKTGFFYWYWEEAPVPPSKKYENVETDDFLAVQEEIDAGNLEFVEFESNEDGTYNFEISPPRGPGKPRIKVWAPQNVAVEINATCVKDAQYMVFRAYVPRQDLIEEGYDEDEVYKLVEAREDTTLLSDAIDQAGEQEERWGSGGSNKDMETVEILYHYIWVFERSLKKKVLYYVVTGGDTGDVVLKREEVDEIPAAMVTPFPIAHRFYGQSLADLLVEPQMQLTALTRIMFDEAYFSLSGRIELSEKDSNKYTLKDAQSGVPGTPIRSKTGQAVRPVQNAGLNFDPLGRIEYVHTMAEHKTGALRSTTGINSDAAHKTKGGYLAQMNMGNVRIREIAVNFAETGYRDLALGIHKMLRRHASKPHEIEINGNFIKIDPSKWEERDNMRLEIANDGGREMDIAKYTQLMEINGEMVAGQGGVDGPLTDHNKILATYRRLVDTMGIKGADELVKSPDSPEQQASPPPEEKPDPAAIKATADAQLAALKVQQENEIAQKKLELEALMHAAEMDFKLTELNTTNDIKVMEIDNKATSTVHKTETEAELKAQIEILKHQLDKANLEARTLLANKQIDTNRNIDLIQIASKNEANNLKNSGLEDAHRSGASQYHDQITENTFSESIDANVVDNNNNDPND